MNAIQFEFEVGQIVNIKMNQKEGKVNGLMVDHSGSKMISVQYVDNNGLVAERWFEVSDLWSKES